MYKQIHGKLLQMVVVMMATVASPALSQDAGVSNVEMVLGNANADVTVTEYASLTCPHCATFHKNTYPELKRDYIDTGKIRFVFREVYFDRSGLIASLVARCGGEEKFFELIDRILTTQSEWSRLDSLPLVAQRLRSIALSMGIEDEQFNACIQDKDNAEFLIKTSQDNAREDGVASTPSFVIGNKTYRNMPYDEMVRLIEDELNG